MVLPYDPSFVHIVAISRNFYGPPWREGVANLLRRAVESWITSGAEVTVISPGTTSTVGRKAKGEFGEVIRYTGRKGGAATTLARTYWLRIVPSLRGVGRRSDVIFLVASARRSLPMLTRMLHRLTGRPVVLYVTGIGLDTKQIKIPTAPARTFVISPYLQAWNPNAEILPPVLPTDFGPEPREPQISDESAPFRFLYLGSLERGRGVAQLVHAYALAWASSERRVALRLAINGLGLPDKEAQLAITRAQHLGADLSIEGVVDLTETYAQCEVVVIPRVGTARMAMPLRLLEALHFAKPLIVTDACDMGTLIRGGGLQVPSGDSDALAEAMVALANDTALYVSCAQSAKAAASHYASTEPLRRLHEALLVASRSGTVKRRGNRVKTQPDN